MGELTGLCRRDAVIVGGGLTGLLLGSALLHAGMGVAILDAGEGASALSTGVATLMQPRLLLRIETAHGVDAVCRHAQALQEQLQALLETPRPYVQTVSVYAHALPGSRELLEKQQDHFCAWHIPACIAPDAGDCPFPVEGGLLLGNQALVDVPRWMDALRSRFLRQGGRLFTASRVIALEGTRAFTAQGCAEGRQIILTAGKPPGLTHKGLLRLLETRLLARCELTGAYPLHSVHQSLHAGSLRLRPTPWGAAAVWDCGRCGTREQTMQLAEFARVLSARLPDWPSDEASFAAEIFPLDGLPVIGPLPGSAHLCATGYSSCGVLGAMHAASVLTRRILGQTQPEDGLYDPARRISPSLARPLLWQSARLQTGNLLRPGAPACAHCGCRMRYCVSTRRWECPRCGSAYTMLGQVITGPGMHNAPVSVHQRPDW